MMERLQRAVVLLTLLEKLKGQGSWCGETHLQKATYFLQELLGVPLGFRFVLYKHGPFAFDLKDEITALQADNLLGIQSRPLPYGPSIVPSENSPAVVERFPRTQGRYLRQIEFVAERLGKMNVTELEKVATALLVSRSGPANETAEQKAERISQLKPHISTEEAKAALAFVEKMSAASTSVAI